MRPGLVLKQGIIDNISKIWKSAKGLLIIEYKGLTVAELQTVRNTISDYNAHLHVFKNRLFKLAVAKDEYSELADSLKGPNGFIFVDGEDSLVIAKKIIKLQEMNKALRLKIAIIDNKIVQQKELVQLALLPSREELLAMLASSLQHPIRMFALSIKEIANSKSASI